MARWCDEFWGTYYYHTKEDMILDVVDLLNSLGVTRTNFSRSFVIQKYSEDGLTRLYSEYWEMAAEKAMSYNDIVFSKLYREDTSGVSLPYHRNGLKSAKSANEVKDFLERTVLVNV